MENPRYGSFFKADSLIDYGLPVKPHNRVGIVDFME